MEEIIATTESEKFLGKKNNLYKTIFSKVSSILFEIGKFLCSILLFPFIAATICRKISPDAWFIGDSEGNTGIGCFATTLPLASIFIVVILTKIFDCNTPNYWWVGLIIGSLLVLSNFLSLAFEAKLARKTNII